MSQLAVIFDVDGVLVDSYDAHFQSWRRLFSELSAGYSEAEFAAGFGRTSREILRDRFGERFTDAELKELDLRKEEYYREAFRDSFVPMDGSAELVAALVEDGFKLAVGSSGPAANVALALELLGIERPFAVKITGADVTRGKPDPQVFQLAAQRLEVPESRCAVIEDAVHGITAANRAGMCSIGITGTAERRQLAHARLVVDSLRELGPGRIRKLILHK